MDCCGGGRTWGHSDLIPIRPSISQRLVLAQPRKGLAGGTGRERELAVPLDLDLLSGFGVQASALTLTVGKRPILRRNARAASDFTGWESLGRGLDTCGPSHGGRDSHGVGSQRVPGGWVIQRAHGGRQWSEGASRLWWGLVASVPFPCRRPDASPGAVGGGAMMTWFPTSPLCVPSPRDRGL